MTERAPTRYRGKRVSRPSGPATHYGDPGPLPALRHDAPVLVVDNRRMGRTLARALADAGVPVIRPAGRGENGADASILLLAVPNAAIADAAHHDPGPARGTPAGRA